MTLEKFLNILDTLNNNEFIYYIKIKSRKFCLIYNYNGYFDYFKEFDKGYIVYGEKEEKEKLQLNSKEYHEEMKEQILERITKENLEKEKIEIYLVIKSMNKALIINTIKDLEGKIL